MGNEQTGLFIFLPTQICITIARLGVRLYAHRSTNLAAYMRA